MHEHTTVKCARARGVRTDMKAYVFGQQILVKMPFLSSYAILQRKLGTHAEISASTTTDNDRVTSLVMSGVR